jgi:hypothetical protein
MLKQTSNGLKTLFLLEFTRRLIRHSGNGEVIELKKILDKNKRAEEIKQIPRPNIRRAIIPSRTINNQKTKQKKFLPSIMSSKEKPLQKKFQIQKPQIKRNLVHAPLRIPKTNLPQRLQYLKPKATDKKVDLGKLNPLIEDNRIKILECNGQNKKIIVKGAMGIKNTDILLTKEEIDKIIKNVSEASKIPVEEGIFKVVFGKLIFSAIISNVIDSKFIIKKIPQQIQMPLRR